MAALAAGLTAMAALPATAATSVALAAGPSLARTAPLELRHQLIRDAELQTLVAAAHNVVAPTLVRLPGLPGAATDFSVTLPEDGDGTGAAIRVQLAPHDVRSPDGYRLLVDDGSGELQDWPAGPTMTVRGTVDGIADARVSGGLVGGGLKLVVRQADGRRTILEPVKLPGVDADAELHLIYDAAAVIPLEGAVCGNTEIGPAFPAKAAPAAFDAPTEGGTLEVAELACDTDFEYFQDYGSVAEVEARITTVMNTVNEQYESQVNITHEITAIVVRTSANDPYTQFSSFGLLCEFITEWTDNQGAIGRDVAQLFTGRNVDGGTIGRAADIGSTGICVNEGGCSGGQFDTFGSYCFSQSDFNGNFASATDLSAHELGHLWGAFHCSCPSFTMNPFITSANQFSGGSISSIINYRNTRTCLNIPAEPEIPGPCCLPNQVCITVELESECVAAGGTFLGEDAECADCASLVGACCLPSGVCVQLDEATCVAAGGAYAGNATNCNDDPCAPDCPADVDGDGAVEFSDLLAVLAIFGPCDGCPEDIDGDQQVAFSDLLSVLSAFGPCP
jgi:hypothetical protein